MEVAQELNIPIIAVNLNGDRAQKSTTTCPPIIRDEYVVHIPFKMKIIKYALDNFPTEFRGVIRMLKVQGFTTTRFMTNLV